MLVVVNELSVGERFILAADKESAVVAIHSGGVEVNGGTDLDVSSTDGPRVSGNGGASSSGRAEGQAVVDVLGLDPDGRGTVLDGLLADGLVVVEVAAVSTGGRLVSTWGSRLVSTGGRLVLGGAVLGQDVNINGSLLLVLEATNVDVEKSLVTTVTALVSSNIDVNQVLLLILLATNGDAEQTLGIEQLPRVLAGGEFATALVSKNIDVDGGLFLVLRAKNINVDQ